MMTRMTDYLRKVVDRLSQPPTPIQDLCAAKIEMNLDERERSVAPTTTATPEVPEVPEVPEPVYDPATDPLAWFIGFRAERDTRSRGTP